LTQSQSFILHLFIDCIEVWKKNADITNRKWGTCTKHKVEGGKAGSHIK